MSAVIIIGLLTSYGDIIPCRSYTGDDVMIGRPLFIIRDVNIVAIIVIKDGEVVQVNEYYNKYYLGQKVIVKTRYKPNNVKEKMIRIFGARGG